MLPAWSRSGFEVCAEKKLRQTRRARGAKKLGRSLLCLDKSIAIKLRLYDLIYKSCKSTLNSLPRQLPNNTISVKMRLIVLPTFGMETRPLPFPFRKWVARLAAIFFSAQTTKPDRAVNDCCACFDIN